MKYIVKVYDNDYCLYEESVSARSALEAESIVQNRYGYVEGEVEYEVDYDLDDIENNFDGSRWGSEFHNLGIDALGNLTDDYSYLGE